jgi:poly(3-hydroxybutyrate) depolymerase
MRRGFLTLFAALMLVASCGGDEEPLEGTAGEGSPSSTSTSTSVATSSTTTSTSVVTSSTTTTATAVEDRVVCGQGFGAGLSTVECEDLSFDVALPEICLEGSCGVIVDVPGGVENGESAERHTGMQELGNAAGYVVVQPNNPGRWWDYPVDSVRMRSFLDQLIEELDVDQNRVHIGGHSAGGYMAWILVCDHADLIASAAPLGAGASTADSPSCDFDDPGQPSEEVDIFLAHGRNDTMVPFDTALAQRDLVVTTWDMTETEVLADDPAYRWTQWTSPQGTVFEFLEFAWSGGFLGNHCYPGASAEIGCGSGTPVHYGEAALDFYIAHPKDE